MKILPYVTYYYPGSFFEEFEDKQLKDYSIEEALESMDKRAFAFILWEKVTQNAKREDGKVFEVTEKINESPKYYPGGAIYTLEDIGKLYGTDSILYSNIEHNSPNSVIKTRAGNFQQFTKDTVVIKDKN